MSPTKLNVFIIILHYRDVQALSDCLHSLSRLTIFASKLAILIVDNGSCLKGKDIFENLSTDLAARITLRRNAGYAAGKNIGI